MSDTSPVSFSRDTLHSATNQLALIVSYANLLLDEMSDSDRRRPDLTDIRGFACTAASLLGRPFRDAEPLATDAAPQGARTSE